jgi:hypothetical protein
MRSGRLTRWFVAPVSSSDWSIAKGGLVIGSSRLAMLIPSTKPIKDTSAAAGISASQSAFAGIG